MPLNLSVRLTLPFSDVSGAVRQWALKADKLLCYEHVGEATEKPHVHLLLMGCSQTVERLKQIARTTNVDGKGNGFWSFKTVTKHHGPITPDTAPKYITYMSKGVHDPSYNKGYELEELQQLKEAWVTPANYNKAETNYLKFEHHFPLSRLESLHNENLLRAARSTGIAHATAHQNLITKYNVVATAARSWAFSIRNSIWDVQTACLAKMVLLTYCMRHQIDIPESAF